MKITLYVNKKALKFAEEMKEEARTQPIVMTTYPLFRDDEAVEVSDDAEEVRS